MLLQELCTNSTKTRTEVAREEEGMINFLLDLLLRMERAWGTLFSNLYSRLLCILFAVLLLLGYRCDVRIVYATIDRVTNRFFRTVIKISNTWKWSVDSHRNNDRHFFSFANTCRSP